MSSPVRARIQLGVGEEAWKKLSDEASTPHHWPTNAMASGDFA
jgi:hypothetical protein